MDVRAMAYRPSVHERALKQLARRRVAVTLVCPTCGEANRPGRDLIELDDHDTAWCGACGESWAVQVDAV